MIDLCLQSCRARQYWSIDEIALCQFVCSLRIASLTRIESKVCAKAYFVFDHESEYVVESGRCSHSGIVEHKELRSSESETGVRGQARTFHFMQWRMVSKQSNWDSTSFDLHTGRALVSRCWVNYAAHINRVVNMYSMSLKLPKIPGTSAGMPLGDGRSILFSVQRERVRKRRHCRQT